VELNTRTCIFPSGSAVRSRSVSFVVEMNDKLAIVFSLKEIMLSYKEKIKEIKTVLAQVAVCAVALVRFS
jgi:hypothetical protein